MTLEKELKALGLGLSAADFRDIVQEVFAVTCPAWTDEELLYHPRDTLNYDDLVRCRVTHLEGRALRRRDLPDHLINRTLVNCRKHFRQEEDAT